VVLGGRDERLSAILRPDTAGDAAQSAFTTTLAQLHKLLGATCRFAALLRMAESFNIPIWTTRNCSATAARSCCHRLASRDSSACWLRALVISVGGLGSPVAMYLAASGVGRLVLVDHDKVVISNLQRQIAHTTDGIGMDKSTSTQCALAAGPDL
jgi:hypothetical protein